MWSKKQLFLEGEIILRLEQTQNVSGMIFPIHIPMRSTVSVHFTRDYIYNDTEAVLRDE